MLIVEDEALIAMQLEDMLEALGLEVVGVAGDAEQAVRLAATQRPDLVTMDVSLPGARDGVDAAREIFELYGTRSLFISAFSDPETVARAAPVRPHGWLPKPLNGNRLAALIRTLQADDDQK